jgi:hypothetical protein
MKKLTPHLILDSGQNADTVTSGKVNEANRVIGQPPGAAKQESGGRLPHHQLVLTLIAFFNSSCSLGNRSQPDHQLVTNSGSNVYRVRQIRTDPVQ